MMARGPRVGVEYAAVLVSADGHQSKVTVKDVSARGFRLEHFDDLREGDEIELRLDKGETLRGRLQWTLGNEAGGLFLDPPPTVD
ncbi:MULTISPECIES: PilZ domain-containing protein [Sphingomonas]|uniref:PilZ domain-containing protein n=1 Tax=Sphingomonas TaxID=13687 RepID=UPI000DEF8FAD|nr:MULTISPECIES: PilZ domain-containing protein [Sphingomonas]